MTERLTQTDFARVSGVSQQAVSRALKTGHLVRTADGRLDPADPQNVRWAAMHLNGYSSQQRHLGTYNWPGREPPRLTALGELLRRWNNIEIDPDFADRLRDKLATDDGRTILAAVLAALPGEFAALRAEMAELRDRLADREK